jgi:hypothetical protein
MPCFDAVFGGGALNVEMPCFDAIISGDAFFCGGALFCGDVIGVALSLHFDVVFCVVFSNRFFLC